MRSAKQNQYTVRSIPPAVDRALRQRARRERKSLNRVVLDLLVAGAGLETNGAVYDDLDDFIGTWKEDAAFDAALAAQDTVDKQLWR